MKARPKKNKSSASTAISPALIMDIMQSEGRPLFLREIARKAPAEYDKATVKSLVEELERNGEVIHIKGNRYGLSSQMMLATGKLLMHRDGFGFVEQEKGKGPDIFIPPKAIKEAVHGDKVIARIEKITGRRPEGSILRILERKTKKVAGTFHRGKNFSFVIPEDERFTFEILIPKKASLKAGHGQIVIAEIDSYPDKGRKPEGRIVEVLGDPEDMDVQTRIVINKYELPHLFDEDVLKEAEELPGSVIPADKEGRKDLRKLPLVTIDGENARDFDDAVHVKKTRTGYALTVAIADVGHYVREGTPVDKSAHERGTSVYFPNKVVPMLPEVISNHLCSLVPNEERLSFTVVISFDRDGNVRRTQFYPAIIKSKRRFTYTEVNELLKGQRKETEFAALLKSMEELALILNKKRRMRGSVDFDLPEPYFILGLRGNIEEIVRKERNIAHQIIEEFMIAANEAVADYLTRKDIPGLYRIHQAPDMQKIENFMKFAQGLGVEMKAPEEITAQWCQRVLEDIVGLPQRYILNTMLLRSMQQAVYSPENIGHFGLASPDYLHFTSPIRRYPDLITHRILKANLNHARKKSTLSKEELKLLGEHCSKRERVAMDAEREMIARLKVHFMADKIDKVFDGIITGVTSFGFFVELNDIFVEGAVRLVDLADDYYRLDQEFQRLTGRRTGRVFQMGNPVTVRLKSVNIPRRHINFEVVEPVGKQP